MSRKQSDVKSSRIRAWTIDLLDIFFYFLNATFVCFVFFLCVRFFKSIGHWVFWHSAVVVVFPTWREGSIRWWQRVISSTQAGVVGRSVGRSVGGETFRPERWSRRFHRDKTPSAGRGPETMTHRRSTRLTTTTRVSVFKKWPSQSFSKKWEVFWRLGAGSESVAGQGQARRPWLQTG